MIFPDLVFGSAGANWTTSGVAIGPISFLTHWTGSARRASLSSVPAGIAKQNLSADR
jgi:hypothetical protein